MKLRTLDRKDAKFMLEWMHDDTVIEYLKADFKGKTLVDCENFIEKSLRETDSYNRAIVDDKDEYMGTVSLKYINPKEKIAEFAIVVRNQAMGKGFSSFGMKEIIRFGHENLGLKNIYWCVGKNNTRAINFYVKNHCVRANEIPEYLENMYKDIDVIWYCSNM